MGLKQGDRVSTTIVQPLRTGRFRHVVFASGLGGRRALNFTESNGCEAAADVSERLTEDERAFIAGLFREANLDLRAYREETLRRRLPACLRALRASSVSHARLLVRDDRKLLSIAISALVIGVTSFFRDAPVFDQLTYHVLPTLFRGPRPLRIWSIGCSDGDELYSVAILLAEMNLLAESYLLGTDCRADAVHRAREGFYDPRALRDVPQIWLEKHFAGSSNSLRVIGRVRSAVQWRTANMLQVHEPGTWDLILCRNALMYMRPEIAGRMCARLEESLRPGGYLVLGKAERPLGATRLSPITPCIYRRDQG
jgi:chemotaxis methyl-accepting protein methylase